MLQLILRLIKANQNSGFFFPEYTTRCIFLIYVNTLGVYAFKLWKHQNIILFSHASLLSQLPFQYLYVFHIDFVIRHNQYLHVRFGLAS